MSQEDMTVDEAVDLFKSVDGIDAHQANKLPNNRRLLVKVVDESAMGTFFGLVRRNGFDRSYTTRDCLEDCELDSWVDV